MARLRVAVVGAGAVGGYIGGKLAAAGTDVVLIDGWVEHVQAIRTCGLTLAESGGASTIKVEALHICDVQSLVRRPIDDPALRIDRAGSGKKPQDRRRTEIDYTSGYVVAKGAQIGIPAPAQSALVALGKRIERGQLPRSRDNLAPLFATGCPT